MKNHLHKKKTFLVLFLVLIGLQDSVGEPPTNTSAKIPNTPDDTDDISLLPTAWAIMDSVYMLKPCNRSREVIQNALWGRISDGPFNYTQDTTCEWLIKAPPGHWIGLKVERVRTECSYDYLFIVDGNSYVRSKLLASFSGSSDPHVNLLAQSGNMLILLYSDPNYVLSGFQAEYSISPCPLNCSGNGECIQIQNQYVCKCAQGRRGVACEQTFKNNSLLPQNFNSADTDNHILVSSSWKNPLERVGHSAIRINQKVYIFGGFDLNIVLNNLITLDLDNHHEKRFSRGKHESSEGALPVGRYAHAGVQYKLGFFIHGGKTAKGQVSGELFYYNITSKTWTELYSKDLPKLMYHSMTLTSSGNIYVFGGGTPNGEFSSKLYQFHGDSPSNWSLIQATCCGKDTHRSVLGHTMTFWPQRQALILFGGVGSSDYGRFSKLSSQLWIFLLNNKTWLYLDYKKNGGVPPGLYPERAFHTSLIVDQYLTIYGGYTHVHNKDETCYSNQLLVYNLECQIFLPIPPSSSNEFSERTLGLFGHQSVIFKEELLIIGGYRGYLNQEIRKIPFPFSNSRSSDCSSFDQSAWRCSGEPQCGWCPTNSRCFPKFSGAVNCTTNLQTVQCPGICPLLTSCQSCVIPGCIWCGTIEQCWKESDEVKSTVCKNPLDNSSQANYAQCAEKNWRMGATQFEYRFPPDFSNPDNVKVINSSVLIIPREYGSTIPADNPVTFALRGSLVGLSFTHPVKKLELCALQAAVNLTLSTPEETFNSSHKFTDYQLCYNLTWPSSGNPVYLIPGQKIRFDLVATSFGKGVAQDKSGRVSIQLKYYAGSISSPRILRKDHLIPYEGVSLSVSKNRHNHHCLLYHACLPCAGDISCVWRLETLKCIPRYISSPKQNELSGENNRIPNPALEITGNNSLIIDPIDCPLCSDNTFCEDCLNNTFGLECEWWEEEMSCQRRGRLSTSVISKEKCPTPCSTRRNCTSCLLENGKCVWCEQRQECFIFSVYTSIYQYGQCFQWYDKADVCKRCDKQPTCESCVLNIGCGWSYNENGGSCSEGDFGGIYFGGRNFQVPLGTDILGTHEIFQDGGNKTWTYGECPDVNECDLGIDDCHFNATCQNSPGSFACFCQQGFTGDGRTNCEQTCHEPCVHGTCTPNFLCECDLGWLGSACNIDCLCNNHSYCSTEGPGTCDECKENTTGENCELCDTFSHGNATLSIGCTLCSCNGHGDIEVGSCDSVTGHCFCLNNTSGRNCEECEIGFYGSPSDGNACYQSCSGRGILEGQQGYFGVPPDLGPSFLSRRKLQLLHSRNTSFVLVEHCMWIIKSFLEEDDNNDRVGAAAGILITIEPGFDIPCSHNVLLVHKGYSEYGINGKFVPLIATVCNDKRESKGTTPTYIRVEGTSATIVLTYARMGTSKFSFDASWKLLGEHDMEIKAGSGRKPTNRSGINTNNYGRMPFNITNLYEGTSPHLSVLSRYGHSLHVDGTNLWIFGGYSLSHGPLNDIRHFSRESNSWVPLTITVLQNDEAAPPARYFHGGVLAPNLVIFIHGGISANLTFLSDFWQFETRKARWNKFCEGPNESPNLAGHTLTLRSDLSSGENPNHFIIVLLGGFNPEEGFSDKVYTIGSTECWTEVETTGSNPWVFGHSTVYHEKTDTFYIFGGTLHDTIGLHHVSISTSARLFALHWPTKRWSVLSPNEENQIGPYPTPRFLHTAVTTDQYMVVLGGIGTRNKENNSTALLYIYQCNLWILVGPDEDSANSVPDSELEDGYSSNIMDVIVGRFAGATAIWNNEIFQMGGWQDGTTSESLFLLSTPTDPCSLQKKKSRCKGTLGCAYCSSNNNHTQQCYKAELEMPSSCSSGASNIEFWKGIACTSTWLTQQGCGKFNSCTECLASWPSHPNVSQICQWCTNNKEGRCVPLKKKVDDETPCGQKQRVIIESSQCPEMQCSAPQCERCTSPAGKCIWTRQILRSRERSWELRLQPVYDWNCVRKTILDTSPSVSVVSSPPASCPIPCWHFDSCQECLESPGAEGGFHQCQWSVSQRRCISPAYSPLLCFGGICGPILKGSPSLCPKACTTLRSCNSCLENPSCGWCSVQDENGEGVCLSTDTMSESKICSNHSKWHYLKCPSENECTNGHHACDAKSEQCIDIEEGYRCQCKAGYERSDTSCVPICTEGCIHGKCVEPGKCQCNFGYVGANCSANCDCNGHSNCAGVDQLAVCLECKNNTMGEKCSTCRPFFVGDPRNNGACIACVDYCNGHSEICLSKGDFNKWCNGTSNYLSSSDLMSKILSSGIQVGPSTTAFCCHCQNQTTSKTCDDCLPGFFRGYDDKRLPCRKCECQGHGDTCDPIIGNNCNCDNNTESEHCSQNTLKQNPHYQCWKHQCSKCKDSYLGSPTNGHQCYIQLQMEEFYCFAPKALDQSCKGAKLTPLLSGRTAFFAVQPKFMNVNIRVTLDVTHGSINVYLSPKEDTFVIKQDENNWIHRVEFDTKYSLTGDVRQQAFGKVSTFAGETIKVDPDYEFTTNRTDDILEESGVNRIISKPMGALPTSAYRFVEQEAAGFSTYFTLKDSKAILLVKNLRNRLVITLPQDSHDLRLTRFYLVLEGIGDVSYGSVLFRQDQLHIDLFVFFSVFFSAFFLFLAGCGIAWKVKQNMETRRARHRHVAEMLSMAKRPFAICTVLLQPDPTSGIAEAYTQCRKSCRKGCICLRPLAVEWASGTSNANAVCTLLITLPGGNNAPVRMCIGSVLANLQRSHAPYHARRRRQQH